MLILDRVARWLECEDPLAKSDIILVLDGGEGGNRFAAGLDLLRQGYAPSLVMSQTIYGDRTYQQVEAMAGKESEKIYWMPSDAVSTRGEAIEARQVLKKLKCRSILVVTSSYHTRRAKKIYTRELEPEGIQVRVVPAPVPGFDRKSWWKSQAGRAVVLFEAAKILCSWLHFDAPLTGGLRYRLKEWVLRTIH